jgi:hypothetical protein
MPCFHCDFKCFLIVARNSSIRRDNRKFRTTVMTNCENGVVLTMFPNLALGIRPKSDTFQAPRRSYLNVENRFRCVARSTHIQSALKIDGLI